MMYSIGIIQSFGTDPICKVLNRFKFLYAIIDKIPYSSCIFQMGVDECHICYSCFRVSNQSICKICDRVCQFAVGL